MRIAITNWSSRRVGGVETYLDSLIPELSRAGHEIAFCCEVDEPLERRRIELPRNSSTWCVAEIGTARTLSELSDWRPDVIYSQRLEDPKLEHKLLKLAPSVFFAHDHNGMCISGTKTFKSPVVRPCNRRFGWQCLMHYFPRRCGGLNPITMVKLYGLQSERLENLHAYDAIVTHSNHMLEELRRHGLSAHRTFSLDCEQVGTKGNGHTPARTVVSVDSPELRAEESGSNLTLGREVKLIFSGRMEYLKGAHVLIDALPEVVAALDSFVRVTLAGDGQERQSLERQAERMRHDKLKVEFTGWADKEQLEELLKTCDLMVIPSLAPESFGLVGVEAGRLGIPAAAFDVGGIRDWLSDGINGYLAPGTPPTAKGLAQAIIKCLSDPAEHARLRQGAFDLAQAFNIHTHLASLLEVFSSVRLQRRAPW